MAFDVTPTSGAAPYTFTADFSNKKAFDFGYVTRFGICAPSTTACPLPESATGFSQAIANTLLQTGVYVRPNTVPAGSCITYVLEILDELGQVIDMQFVEVSNL